MVVLCLICLCFSGLPRQELAQQLHQEQEKGPEAEVEMPAADKAKLDLLRKASTQGFAARDPAGQVFMRWLATAEGEKDKSKYASLTNAAKLEFRQRWAQCKFREHNQKSPHLTSVCFCWMLTLSFVLVFALV